MMVVPCKSVDLNWNSCYWSLCDRPFTLKPDDAHANITMWCHIIHRSFVPETRELHSELTQSRNARLITNSCVYRCLSKPAISRPRPHIHRHNTHPQTGMRAERKEALRAMMGRSRLCHLQSDELWTFTKKKVSRWKSLPETTRQDKPDTHWKHPSCLWLCDRIFCRLWWVVVWWNV